LNRPPGISLVADWADYMTLRDWLHRLAKARNDPQIHAVALELDSPRLSWAQAVELADAVDRLRKANKRVFTFLTSGGPAEYLIASAGSEVAMEPAGKLLITGLAAEVLFFRGALDWLGIQPDIIQIGRFKGAAEPLTRTEPSKELQAELDKLLDDLYDQMCGQIARQRALEVEKVRAAIDAGPLTAKDAQEHRLIDRRITKLAWREQLGRQIEREGRRLVWREGYGAKPRKRPDFSNPFQLLSLLAPKTERPRKDPTIAIIHADGLIVRGQSRQSLFGVTYVGDKTITDCFEDVRQDPHVKAVVFRIDSHGGSALASELIYQAVSRCAKEKPVIASVSDVAGSGGYYIAAGATRIIADPSAVVGSIGVMGGKLSIAGLLDKLKIGAYQVTRGRNAGLWLSRPWTDHERRTLRKLLRDTYDTFVQRVKEGRAGRIRDMDQVAQGHVFTARQAVRNGLVDQLGGLKDAVLAARKAAGIPAASYITLPRPRGLGELLGNGMLSAAPATTPGRLLIRRRPAGRADALACLLSLAELLREEKVLAAAPYVLSIRR
jgi:protease-4